MIAPRRRGVEDTVPSPCHIVGYGSVAATYDLVGTPPCTIPDGRGSRFRLETSEKRNTCSFFHGSVRHGAGKLCQRGRSHDSKVNQISEV